MEKKIEDYGYLYVGSLVQDMLVENGERYTLDRFTVGEKMLFTNGLIKLVLRPIASITEEEFVYVVQAGSHYSVTECYTEIDNDRKYLLYRLNYITRRSKQQREFYPIHPQSRKYSAETVKYLLSKSFDLFGLIEAGLAIDSTKL